MVPEAQRRGAVPFLIGVFLVCMSGLMLQIVETRILSVITYYHLAFFSISMAMLGLSLGALLVHFNAERFSPASVFEDLAWIAAACAIAIFISTMSLITTIAPSSVANTYLMTAVGWLKLIFILLPPYVFAGMAISLALTRSALPPGIVYGADLVGAASGCFVTLGLLGWFDAVSAMIAIAAITAMASVCFAVANTRSGLKSQLKSAWTWLGKGPWPAVFAASFAVIAAGNAAVQPTTESKQLRDGLVLLMSKNALELTQPAVTRWNSFSRIIATREHTGAPQLWGPSSQLPSFTVSQRHLDIDGSAGTEMYKFDGDLSKLDFLRYDITNLGYAIRHSGRSAVIGVGGGRDLLSAYLYGFRDVTGVELNPIFIDLLSKEFRTYNDLAYLPGVRLFVDDGRSWFARTNERFDLIQMSLVDTWASTAAGAFSLSENGLYTVEAWQHFLSALTPTGIFTVSRWFNPDDVTETGRLLSLAAAALRHAGAVHPSAHIFVAATDKLATLIVARAPLTADEIALLRARASALHFRVLVSPDQDAQSGTLKEIVEAGTREGLADLSRRYHLDLSVTTDDRPFFFNELVPLDPASIRMAINGSSGIMRGNLIATIALLLIVGLSTLVALLTLILPAISSVRQTATKLAQLGSLYFLLIGLGFMFVEMGLIQRLSVFLGHPVYGLSIGLFGIILSTGLGSLLSEQLSISSPPRIIAWAMALAVYLGSLPGWLPSALATFEGSALGLRILISVATILPAGLLMGFGFPTGMRLVNAIDPRPTPWFWAVNGVAGVFGSSVAVATSIAFSINVSLWVGAVCYAFLAPVGAALMSMSVERVSRLGAVAA